MGCGAVFRHVVHTLGTYLDLQIGALAVLYCDVQRLVAAGPRGSDPVAQALGVGFVFFGHVRIDLPAEVLLGLVVGFAVYDEADCEHVIDPFERHLLHLHLAVDGVGALRAYFQGIAYAGGRKLLLQRLYELLLQPLAVPFGGFQLVGDGPVLLRLGVAEVDVSQLAVDFIKSQLVREGHIQHQGLQQLLVPGHLGKHRKVAHHLEPVGYLDDAHPGVGRILDDELFVVFSFEARVFRLYGGYLVEPVHHHLHILRETADVYVFMDARRFVQIHSGSARFRQADFVGDDAGRAVGVTYEGRSVIAGLPFECRKGDLPGSLYHLLV